MASSCSLCKTERVTKRIKPRHDKNFGLGISESNNVVYVTCLAPGSTAADEFKLDDRIVSVNGVAIKSKDQCKNLILELYRSETEFEIVVERPPDCVHSHEGEEELQIKQLGRGACTEVVPSETGNKEKSKGGIEEYCERYRQYLLDNDETTLGNSLDGLKFPKPADIRQIIHSKIDAILADYEKPMSSPSSKLKPSEANFKIESDTHKHDIPSEVPMSKPLMKPKKK